MAEPTVSEFIGILHISAAFFACGHILLTKEDEKTAMAWIGIVLLSPIVGSVIYFLLGVNRMRRKAAQLRGFPPRYRATYPDETAGSIQLPDISLLKQMHILGRRAGFEDFTVGNCIRPLMNGDEAYPAMLQAIAAARETVAMSTYIFDRDKAGLRFVKGLAEAKRRGVKVYVIVDGVGVRWSNPTVEGDLTEAGVKVARFLPTKFRSFRFVNLRNHRKILLVDGQSAFVGGINIREGNLIEEDPAKPVRDVHFLVQGPVISQINAVFEDDWRFAAQERISLPPWDGDGGRGVVPVFARAISEGPDNDRKNLQWLISGAIACAQERIRIATPYFLPNLTVINALQVAALRGIAVDIVVPEKSNVWGFAWAMSANFPRLLESGIRIFLNPPPFDHSKILLIDRAWCCIGSSNWDTRSFSLNFEINLECVDADLVAGLDMIFEAKRAASRMVCLDTVRSFGPAVRLRNNAARLFSPYL
jgi:cardiolipin synthase